MHMPMNPMNPEHAWIAPVGSDPDDLDGWTDVGYVREDPQPELEEQHACYCLVPGTYRDTGARHYFQAATCERERPVRRYAIIDGVWHDRLGMPRDRSLASGTVRQYFRSVTFYPTGRIETRADGAVGEHMGPEGPQPGNDEPWRIPGGFVAEFEGGPLGD